VRRDERRAEEERCRGGHMVFIGKQKEATMSGGGLKAAAGVVNFMFCDNFRLISVPSDIYIPSICFRKTCFTLFPFSCLPLALLFLPHFAACPSISLPSFPSCPFLAPLSSTKVSFLFLAQLNLRVTTLCPSTDVRLSLNCHTPLCLHRRYSA
jgi:hypothetical protein